MSRRFDIALMVTVLVFGGLATYMAITKIDDRQQAQARTSYEQDIRSWQERLVGCERGRLDRRMNRQGWESARRRTHLTAIAPSTPPDVARLNRRASRAYALIVLSFQDRIEGLRCLTAYPVPHRQSGVPASPAIKPTILAAGVADASGQALELRIRALSLGD